MGANANESLFTELIPVLSGSVRISSDALFSLLDRDTIELSHGFLFRARGGIRPQGAPLKMKSDLGN